MTPGLRAAGDAGTKSPGPSNAAGALRDPDGRDRGRRGQRPRGEAGGGGWRGPAGIREPAGLWAGDLRKRGSPARPKGWGQAGAQAGAADGGPRGGLESDFGLT